MRRARRGQSEVIGAILIIPIIISLFVAGSAMMQQSAQQLERVNMKMREHLIVIPEYVNNTLYARILNVGPRPVQLAYIILYNVNSSARQPVIIQQIDDMIAPGSNITLPIASNLANGKYEIDIITRLGNVFGWDPKIGSTFSIPPTDAILSVNPTIKLSSLVGKSLASLILENYSVVGFESVSPIVFNTSIVASTANLGAHLSIFINNFTYNKYKTNGAISFTTTNTTITRDNITAGYYIKAYIWAVSSIAGEYNGIRLIINYILTVNTSTQALMVLTINKLENIFAPSGYDFNDRIGLVYVVNGTILSINNNKYIILINNTGSIILNYKIWKITYTSAGKYKATLRGYATFANINIVYLEKK